MTETAWQTHGSSEECFNYNFRRLQMFGPPRLLWNLCCWNMQQLYTTLPYIVMTN